LRDWEQGRAEPDQPARAYLTLIARDPAAAERALAGDAEGLPLAALNTAFAADGRSVNNVVGYPGIFRGALQAGAASINVEMKLAAAHAIAAIVDERELREDYIIPSVFNRDVAPAVAAAVAEQARTAGTALAGQEVGFAQGDALTGASAGVQVVDGRV